MFDFNSPLIGLVIRIIAALVLIYVLYLQLKANNTPRDKFTRTRMTLTTLLSGIIVLLSPGTCYLYLRVVGIDNELLRGVSTVSTSLIILFVAFMLLVLYLQQVRKDT